MDARIRFETMEVANVRREREFMALSPAERLQWFLRSFEGRSPADAEAARNKDNFIVEKRKDVHR
ncbi:MAG: hypothetical protein JNM31_04885 [Flavobacteriales bacterium]|nr:hypothetical protein [Flavobacteriales bacterium]